MCADLFRTNCSCLFVCLSLDIHHHHHHYSSSRGSSFLRLDSCHPHRGLACTSLTLIHCPRLMHLSITSARFLICHEHGSICIAHYRQTSTPSRTHQSPAVDRLVFCSSRQRREISHIVTCTTWSYACTLGGLSQYDFYLRICAQHYSIRTPHTTI